VVSWSFPICEAVRDQENDDIFPGQRPVLTHNRVRTSWLGQRRQQPCLCPLKAAQELQAPVWVMCPKPNGKPENSDQFLEVISLL